MTAAQGREVADAELVGRFGYSSIEGRWRWDDAAALLHGTDAGRESVTTDELLELVHAPDRERVAAVVDDPATPVLRLSYRVSTSERETRSLLVLAQEVRRDEGGFRADGVVVDVTPELREAGDQGGRAAVEAVLEGRGAIEQAKGVLMLVYGLSEDQAFALLRWWSRNHNLRLRLLAERLVAAAQAGTYSGPELRARLDRSLHDLTADPHP